jgi:hypothetical protein
MPSSCCRNCPKPKLSLQNRPPESSIFLALPANVIRPSRRAATGLPHLAMETGRQSTGRGVALEYRQETRIDSDLATLFRLPTEVIRPLGEDLFSFLA